MAKKDLETLTVTGGENRSEKNVSIKTYHVLVTPTGQEFFLSQGGARDFLRKMATRKPAFTPGMRCFEEEYTIVRPCLVKTFSILSAFGKLTRVANIYVEVDPNTQLITYTGWNGFGSFTGRGTLVDSLMDVSNPLLNVKEDNDLNLFNYKILAPAIGSKAMVGKAKKDLFHRQLLM